MSTNAILDCPQLISKNKKSNSSSVQPKSFDEYINIFSDELKISKDRNPLKFAISPSYIGTDLEEEDSVEKKVRFSSANPINSDIIDSTSAENKPSYSKFSPSEDSIPSKSSIIHRQGYAIEEERVAIGRMNMMSLFMVMLICIFLSLLDHKLWAMYDSTILTDFNKRENKYEQNLLRVLITEPIDGIITDRTTLSWTVDGIVMAGPEERPVSISIISYQMPLIL